ncbi:MAG: serine/threonine protein kinase [Deltaproteobacteria bacterium]|nr:serine/threonine protein kinase [Deltaproteobacteria bacterium]
MSEPARATTPIRKVGRFEMFEEIGVGGFASVHFGRAVGAGGFSRPVAIKRLHRMFAGNPEVRLMFLDEARLVSRISHPNVLPTLDLVAEDDELFIVMEYIKGATLGHLLKQARRRGQRVPIPIDLRVVADMLHGLHAAHEAQNERGEPLGLVHRDATPDNVMVGADGFARLLDFGVAKAMGRLQTTARGELKGKFQYMAPEQIRGGDIDRRTDIFAASVVLWQLLTQKRLFAGSDPAEIMHAALHDPIEPPGRAADGIPSAIDDIVLRGLERDPAMRWPTAEQMVLAIEGLDIVATHGEVGEWVRQMGAEQLADRSSKLAVVEQSPLSVPETRDRLASGPHSGVTPPTAGAWLERSQPSGLTPTVEGSWPSAASQVSSASVSRAIMASQDRLGPEPRRWPMVLLVAGVLGVGALTGTGWLLVAGRGSGPAPAVGPAPTASAVAGKPSAEEPAPEEQPEPSSVAPARSGAATPAGSAATSASAEAAAARDRERGSPPAGGPARGAPSAKPGKPRSSLYSQH